MGFIVIFFGKHIYKTSVSDQERAQGGGVEVNAPNPLRAWYFTKTLLPAQRRLIVFAYFLLVNLST